ncbi:ATP-binding protein [Planobispora takensis]|uniref:Large ATP-binding protein n=1 Tax=Planobispora takensis TaxID=1367882 RepID=A0A8J3WRH0_9ACTN|nr:ATP-binding protein [Planobispora takensis]GIH99170.1 hypothetical protein Pta02_11790 [Planobispora takensis]
MSAPNLPVPAEGELYAAIADKLPGLEADRVRAILAEHGVRLSSPLPARRQLCVRRLYCEGTKQGTTDNDGPFAIDIPLTPGPWAIASKVNSAGKSSLLWALSWALRGESVEEYRRPDTPGWFSYIRADVEVAGVAASIRLTFERPERPRVSLLTADTIEQLLALAGQEEQGPGVRIAASAPPAGVKALIERFMLDRLGLRPISTWAAEPNAPADADGHRDSSEQLHSWSAFYYAIALNAGRDKILLGPTAFGQLPAKLLQIFLDVPYAAELTQLTSAQKQDAQEDRRIQRRADEDAQARAAQLAPLRQALARAQARLDELEAGQPDLSALLAAADAAARQVAAEQDRHAAAQEQLADARKAHLKDRRAARSARQSAAARLLLGALDPEACPRCDHEIDEPRRAAEHAEHRCAVCARPLPELQEDAQAQAQALQRLDAREQASRAAQERAGQAVAQAAAALQTSRIAHEQAHARLQAARSSDWFTALEEARRQVHQLEGALGVASGASDALPAAVSGYVLQAAAPADSIDQISQEEVIATAIEVISEVVREHSKALFADLNEKIVTIAQRLGVTNLTSVNLDLAGKVNARKSGVSHPFARFSPGERLRMRIATVIGMIVVGREHGIMSHPGLLLIDAPTAEEVVPGDAHTVLQALYETALNVPGVQLVITSIEDAVWKVFTADRIVTGPGDRYLF